MSVATCTRCGHVHARREEAKRSATGAYYCTWCSDNAPPLTFGARTCACDGCGKDRRDVRSCGKDYNGDPDAPDLCFLCRQEDRRGRVYSRKLGRYVPIASLYDLEHS